MSSLFVDNVTRVPTNVETDFFRLWVDFLKPYHDLTERESEVLTCLLKCRNKLKKDIHNDELLDQALFSESTKRKIYTDLGVTASNFHVLIARLKKKGIIIEDKLNKRFIPKLKDDAKEFKMLILFDFNDDRR